MIEITKEQILKTAQQMAKENKKWHFHILTPECQLNEKDQYALVLESSTGKETLVSYSKMPYMDIGQKLVRLLHGNDIVQKEDAELKPPSPQVQKLLNRAKNLSQQGNFWHHHMLFPDCIFNQHSPNWAIIFEDQEAGEIIESLTDTEPKSDLKHIEGIFYSQKGKK